MYTQTVLLDMKGVASLTTISTKFEGRKQMGSLGNVMALQRRRRTAIANTSITTGFYAKQGAALKLREQQMELELALLGQDNHGSTLSMASHGISHE